MATAESRAEVRDDDGRILHHEHLTLRFWQLDSKTGRFVLTTYVDSPHKAAITSLVFHPRRDLVVSTSMDKTFNVWQRTVPVVRSSTSKSSTTADTK
jgi:WD40 repeat protein